MHSPSLALDTVCRVRVKTTEARAAQFTAPLLLLTGLERANNLPGGVMYRFQLKMRPVLSSQNDEKNRTRATTCLFPKKVAAIKSTLNPPELQPERSLHGSIKASGRLN